MIRNLIKIALIALVAIVGYNYFFGDEDEKQQSQQIIDGIKNVGIAAYDLIQDEIQKAKEGKYDQIVDKLQASIDALKGKESTNQEEVNRLQTQLNQVDKDIQNHQSDSSQTKEWQEKIKKELQSILDQAKSLEDSNH